MRHSRWGCGGPWGGGGRSALSERAFRLAGWDPACLPACLPACPPAELVRLCQLKVVLAAYICCELVTTGSGRTFPSPMKLFTKDTDTAPRRAQVGGNGGHSATATMGARIAAAHRWCVTGTPIGPGGMTDVLGLLRALHAAPFDARPSDFQVGRQIQARRAVGGSRGCATARRRAAPKYHGTCHRAASAHRAASPTKRPQRRAPNPGAPRRAPPAPAWQDAVSVPYLRGRPWGRRALAALLRPLM
jgi:hypothetical protein